jgi:plastocyanin
MKTATAIGVASAIIIVGAAWYFIFNNSAASPAGPNTQTQTNQNPNGPDFSPNGAPGQGAAVDTQTAPMSVTVTYGPNGFSPSSVTVAKGGTVTWVVSQGADEMWVASAPHPAHTGYDGTSKSQHCAAGYAGAAPFDQCSAGTTYSFTFNQSGTWGYHNHGNSSDYGTVIVQ